MRCALLVEGHAAFRQAIAYLRARDLRIEIVEEVSTLAEARTLVLKNLETIDVVVSELTLPDGEAVRPTAYSSELTEGQSSRKSACTVRRFATMRGEGSREG